MFFKEPEMRFNENAKLLLDGFHCLVQLYEEKQEKRVKSIEPIDTRDCIGSQHELIESYVEELRNIVRTKSFQNTFSFFQTSTTQFQVLADIVHWILVSIQPSMV
jgi:hypothetical protein